MVLYFEITGDVGICIALATCAELFQVRPCRFQASFEHSIIVNENSIPHFNFVNPMKVKTKLKTD